MVAAYSTGHGSYSGRSGGYGGGHGDCCCCDNGGGGLLSGGAGMAAAAGAALGLLIAAAIKAMAAAKRKRRNVGRYEEMRSSSMESAHNLFMSGRHFRTFFIFNLKATFAIQIYGCKDSKALLETSWVRAL